MSARVDRPLAHRLLGRHVLGRPEGKPGLRHPRAAGGTHRQRDAEVRDERAAVVEQNILRLDVAVDHAMPVRVVERARHLARETHRVVDRELMLAGEPGAKRLPFDVRHHVEEQPVRVAALEQRQDVRVLELSRGLDLGEESLGAERRREVRMQHLDRDVAIVLEVVREVDRGHPSRAELALDEVAIRQGPGEARNVAGHGARTRSSNSAAQLTTTTTPALPTGSSSTKLPSRATS